MVKSLLTRQMTSLQDRVQPSLFELHEDLSPLLATDSPFGSLSEYAEEHGRNVWGCDIGNTNWYVSKNGTYESKWPLSSFLLLPFCEDGDLVLVENAHMQPQKEEGSRSLAQVYQYKDLERLKALADRRSIDIRLVPHKLTPAMRLAITGTDRKTDQVDCAVIANHVLLKGGVANLQRFAPRPVNGWTKKEEYAYEAVRDMNITINNQRLLKRADGESPHTIAELKRLYAIYFKTSSNQCSLSDRIRSLAVEDAAAKDALDWIFDKTQLENPTLIALWTAVYGSDCKLRSFECSDQPLGLNYIWRYLLGNKPNHFKAGVARSNLCHWTFKSIVKEKITKEKITINPSDADRQAMVALRVRFRKACFLVMRTMQELAVD